MFHIDPIIPDRRHGKTTGWLSRTVATSDCAFCFIPERAGTSSRSTGPAATAPGWKVLCSDTGTWAVVPLARYYSPVRIVQRLAKRGGDQKVEDPVWGSGAMVCEVAQAEPTGNYGEALGEDEWDDDIEASSRFSMVFAALNHLCSNSGDKPVNQKLISCVLVDPPYLRHGRSPNWLTTPRPRTKLLTAPEKVELSEIQGPTWAMSGLQTKRLTARAYPTDISERAISLGSALTDSSPQLLDYTRAVFDAVVVRIWRSRMTSAAQPMTECDLSIGFSNQASR